MRIIIAQKIKFKHDGLTSAVFIGTDEKQKKRLLLKIAI